MTKRFRYILPAILCALVAVALAVAFTSIKGASATTTQGTPSRPVILDGHWHQTKSGISAAVMDATVKNNEIQINVTMSGESTGLYWKGSFDSGGSNLDPFSITSVGDTKAMDLSLYASQDSSKVFYYHNGVLSYPFSIMGVSTTVELSRS
jgi:hypothetical protein